MASKNPTEKCGTQIKGGTAQKTSYKLEQKLQLDLERDILRLFQDSIYCDIKFAIHSSSLLTHSCILRARASKFYKFIYAELEVLEENGISVFNVYNASFAYLQKFLENIYTNFHSFHAEDKIIKHLKESKYQSLESIDPEKSSVSSAITPEADLFFTPKCSPSELQKPFAPSKLKISENDVASYYKITVDDIPVDEKLEGTKLKSVKEGKLLEKELAEQDELLSSFQTIFSKKNKSKPNSLSLGTSSQPAKKTKPKFNRRFDSNFLLLDNHDKNKYILPHWKPNPVIDPTCQRDKYSTSVKTVKKNLSSLKSQEKVELGICLEDLTNSVSSDMDVSTTAGDSGLDFSLICQQETSPRENTMSETSGVDLTEGAINEDIPNDETISTKQSSGSSVSSEPGTWDANDDYKVKLPSNACDVDSSTANDSQAGILKDSAMDRNQLNEDEITRLDEMEKNIRDCEMFLYVERRASGEESHKDYSVTDDNVPGSLDSNETLQRQRTYQYAEEKRMSNPEEFLQGETDHCQNSDEGNYFNYSYCIGKNLNDVISPKDKNYECHDANEFLNQGVADDTISSNSDQFAQPDNLRNVQETKTPPCTPKKIKKEEPDVTESVTSAQETKSANWENNNSTGVSNYFIDASSLLDEDEIISPPISLINFKPIQSFVNNEANNINNNNNVVEEPKTVSKKVVTNFYTPDSSDDVSFQKENERRQGDIIFKNSIPHYSKHEVEENRILDSSDRLRGGSDIVADDESEQVVPSADYEFSPPCSLVNRLNSEECSYSLQSDCFEPRQISTEIDSEQNTDFVGSANDLVSESRENYSESKDLSCSSRSCESPNLRRRNESAPILSGGMDFVEEEEKVQKKPSQLHGEAWIVTFENKKKTKNKLTGLDNKKETGDDIKLQSVCVSQSHEGSHLRRKEPSVEFYVNKKHDETNSAKSEPKMYPIEKSNSSGYFINLSNDSGDEVIQQPVETKSEKKNMFSMFIGMDDNSDSASTSLKNFRPPLEREDTYNKFTEDVLKETPKTDQTGDRKKPFYMFIESDSPIVRRKPMPNKPSKISADSQPSETTSRRNYFRTQSYTIQRNSDMERRPEVKTDFECSSSDNSLPYSEANFKTNRAGKGKVPLPLNKFRNFDSNHEPRMTAWSDTKQPNDGTIPSESWLKTKDIQINYREKNKENRNDVYTKKNSTFTMNEYKDKYLDKYKNKTPERDSGVVLSDKGDDNFVKLSDLDSSDSQQTKQITENRMSQSTSEERNEKAFGDDDDIPLSKSLGSEGNKTSSKTADLYAKNVNRSLIRLFPNLNAESLARIGRRDEADETSEVSSSMQSSVEPSGLEISTSETDVSTHAGTTTSRLGEDLLKMFLEEISPDIVIDVNGRRIKAHKCVLSSRCQYFAALLSGGWVESAGNVISLQGFSYNAVHFALRHIYSGESRIPESLSIVELATLADMLCLDGLQEIISCNLKVKYCHSFHVPCSVCSVGVIDCLPVAAAYGLDDLYRKCLRWITKYFVKIWPTKSFGSLPKELLEKCYQHYVVHMTVDNVLDTIVNIDKVRGSLPNVRWAESVSRLVNKLHDATVRYIAEHFSSVLTSDNFLALGKEANWNVSRLEDSLIETVRYLPPEQACWSHARLHRILSVATGPNPPPEMDWNENFLKLLQIIAELVENNLIKQAPRAAKSKAWRQMEPELRSRIQVAACLVLPDEDQSSGNRRSNFVKKEVGSFSTPQAAKNRNFEIRQIKLAMSQQTHNRNPITNRPLSLQMDQRSKKDSRFLPLRPSMSTSSVRKSEPQIEGIRKTQSRSHILGNNTSSEPKKTINSKYSEVKSRYLDPKSPLKSASDKPGAESNQRRNFRTISSSDSSRNCSPALRSSNSRSSIPQAKKSNFEISKHPRSTVLKSGSTTALDTKKDRNFVSDRSDTMTIKTLSRINKEQNMSTDSLCTDSLASEKDATVQLRRGKENLGERKKAENLILKSNSNSPVLRRHSSGSWSSSASKTNAPKKLTRPPNDSKSNPPKRFTAGKISNQNVATSIPCKSNVSSPRTTTAKRNQRNAGKVDANLVNGNTNRKKTDVDSENNKKNLKDTIQPLAVERSGTFLKDEPTILKKPQVGTEV